MSDERSVVFKMNNVHDAVNEGGNHERRRPDEKQAREQGIEGREQLASVRRDRIHRPHAAQNHGRVHEGVDPRQATEVVIAQHADTEGDADGHGRQTHKPTYPPEKAVAGQERIAAVLKHAQYRNSPTRAQKSGGAA